MISEQILLAVLTQSSEVFVGEGQRNVQWLWGPRQMWRFFVTKSREGRGIWPGAASSVERGT